VLNHACVDSSHNQLLGPPVNEKRASLRLREKNNQLLPFLFLWGMQFSEERENRELSGSGSVSVCTDGFLMEYMLAMPGCVIRQRNGDAEMMVPCINALSLVLTCIALERQPGVGKC